MLFWKGETIKDINPNLPIPQIIASIKDGPPSELRGVTSTNRVSSSGVPKKLKKTQLEHTENLGAIAQKGKKLETKQISEKHGVFQPIINTSTYMVQRNHIEDSCVSRIESQGKVEHESCIQEHESSIQDLTDTIAVGSYEEPVDSYADGTWQIVKSKKSHG
jgi:hypothetical protein